MVNAGASIEAFLKLDASQFKTGLDGAIKSVESFKKSMMTIGKESNTITTGLNQVSQAISHLIQTMELLNSVDSKAITKFRNLASALNNIANAARRMGADVRNGSVGMEALSTVIEIFNAGVSSAEVHINATASQLRKLTQEESSARNALNQLRNGFDSTYASANRLRESFITMDNSTRTGRANLSLYHQGLKQLALGVEQFNAIETQHIAKEEQVATATNQATNSIERQNVASRKGSVAQSKMASGTSRLRNAMSSLKTMGMLVGSMMVYNFAHNLITATRETVNAKSEMEGYFKMLKFSQGDINHFNKALNETVQQFQRVNKYSLGETISSIGVEFNLSTKEMERAMKVTSMITSEYLRAGRNANEASLAVKDVLQGQFQRLSRETGVKGSQLKEAGWSGDTNDVLGLMDALEKVGKSRNWDVFAEKANSLNDIVTITQNRFGEWSAEMVNVVQPSIVSAFNSIKGVAEKVSVTLGGAWKWLNTKGLGQTITKLGLLGTAFTTLIPLVTAYRAGTGLLQASTMGLTQSIGALVFGLNAEALATTTTSEAIGMKLLGITSEQLEESSLITVINGMIAARSAEAGATDLATGSNLGFLGGLSAMITGETIAEGTTISLSGAIGLLTGAMLTNPITWFAGAILALAGAFYVLSGGLSDVWDKTKRFNEVMESPQDSIKPYKDEVDRLNGKLEKAKEKYGENSKQVEKYNEKLNTAKETLDDVTHAVEHGSYWNKQYEKSFGKLGVTMDSSLRGVMKQHNFTKEQISGAGELVDVMDTGTKRYYKALQVLHFQQKQSKKDLDEYATSLEKAGITGDEASKKMGEMSENMRKFQEHSAIANTTDDWWEWMWNSLYAGLDKFWINLEKDGLFGALGDGGLANGSGWMAEWFQNNISKPISDWWNGVVGDPLASLGVDFGEIDILDLIMNALFPAPASASDGSSSSDHPSFMEDISAILGFDIQQWVTDFNNDPLGTLGITIPTLDLGQVFNIGGAISGFTTELGKLSAPISGTISYVTGAFSGLAGNIRGALSRIGSNVSQGFQNAKQSAVDKMTAMKDGVSKAVHKLIDAFSDMKNKILEAAKKIKDGVKEKFDGVKDTIGGFYHKLTNPSEWLGGSGVKSYSRSPKPNTARKIFSSRSSSRGKHGAGVNPYQKSSNNKTITLNELVNQLGGSKRVNLTDFLSLFADSGFGGWNFASKHKKTIFKQGKSWKADSPSLNGTVLGNGFPVKRFWNGKATGFKWNEFMAVASALFSAIPYKFYMDSDWKGDWVSALLSGATNCSDGSDALIALASLFGFSGDKIHTNLKDGMGHFFAIINGHKMDTTNFQHSGSWRPLGGAGASPRGKNYSKGDKTVNITNDFSGATIYGVDDLDSRIKQSTKDAIREEFNDPYTVAI